MEKEIEMNEKAHSGKTRGISAEEIGDRINAIPIHPLPGSECDEFGFCREGLLKMAPFGLFLYEKWFRVDLNGVENIPDRGPAIIVPNHSGQLPLDGAMISVGCLAEKETPRMPRAMVEKWIPTLPMVSKLMANAGQVVGITENAERLLERGELLMIFPEGAVGLGKTWDKRYQLQRFTVGFMELAIRYKCPIIPTAMIGCEEQAPSLYNMAALGKKLGLLYFPITPTFPLLGALGFIPLPSKYHIYFGEPMDFSGHEDELEDPIAIQALADSVKARVQEMIEDGLKKRPFPGF